MSVPDTFWQVLTPLVVVVTGMLTSWWNNRNHTATANELAEIKRQTNGINTTLQNRIDKQEVDRVQTAALTEKDKQIVIARAEDPK